MEKSSKVKFEYIPFAKLVFLENNPRTRTQKGMERMAADIKKDPSFYENRPTLVNVVGGEFRVYAGDLRAHAAHDVLGWESIPCNLEGDVPNDVQARRAILDNTHHENWDSDLLANWGFDVDELGEMSVPGWVYGADESEGGVPNNALNSEAQEDDFEVPEVETVKTDIVLGDLLEIGPHRLLCGDSTDFAVIEKLMCGRKANVVITDPDFSMDIDALKTCYENTKKVLDGVAFWICADKQAVQLSSNDFENFARFFVQDFRQPTLVANNQPMTRHVMICQFGRKAMNNLFDGFSTLLQIATDRTSEVHKTTPMSKKVELPAQFISHYSDTWDVVLDIFSHSGSTMVAAHQLNRKCYGMELIPKYCQVIVDRMLKLDPTLEVKKNGVLYERKN